MMYVILRNLTVSALHWYHLHVRFEAYPHHRVRVRVALEEV